MKQPYFFSKTDRQFYAAFCNIWGWAGKKDISGGRRQLEALLVGGAGPKNGLLQYHLGLAYWNGLIPSEDPTDSAMLWFCRSADELCPDGQRAVRHMKSILMDHAQKGDPEAQYRLARYLHWNKRKRQRDRWLRCAADQDYMPAKRFWNQIPHPGGLSEAKRYDMRILNEQYTLEPLSLQLRDGFEGLNARYARTLREVSSLGDRFDLLSKGQSQLRQEVLSFFRQMEEQVRAFAVNVPEKNRKQQEERLKAIFGASWTNGQLHSQSRESLIAAYTLMECAQLHQITDYRGIVISVTSVLERELKARFYTGYRDYLDAKGEPVPECLTKAFTLGSLYYIISDKTFSPTRKSGDPRPASELKPLNNYLSQIVSDGLFRPGTDLYYSDVFIYHGGSNSFSWQVNDVLRKYRNPAAHTEATSRDTAEACCEQVVGVQDVQNVVGLLQELMQKTDKFCHPL